MNLRKVPKRRKARLKRFRQRRINLNKRGWLRGMKDRAKNCQYCGVSFDGLVKTADHVIPMALGGCDEPQNIRIVCEPCNRRKGNSVFLDLNIYEINAAT